MSVYLLQDWERNWLGIHVAFLVVYSAFVCYFVCFAVVVSVSFPSFSLFVAS